MNNHNYWMQNLIELLKKEISNSVEVPVGAMIVDKGKILSTAFNKREETNLATAHAEILAINSANKTLDSWRLTDTTIYITLEPCSMCLGAILNARIKNIVFASFDYKTGSLGGKYNMLNYVSNDINVISGICADENSKILSEFFKKVRK